MSIRFNFNAVKATQAAALVLKARGGRCTRIELIKLLYLADREALNQLARPITGDAFVNMDKGPVLSAIFDFVKGNQFNPSWKASIKTEGSRDLVLKADPGDDEFSDKEVQILNG